MLVKIILAACLFVIPLLLQAHGSFEIPISRVYACFLEGPENPQSAACQDMVDIGGTQPLYDWMEVNQFNAAGEHLSLIPDGTLCAGGRDKYRGLNQARTDWVSTAPRFNSKGQMEFVYHAWAPHSTDYFRYYITKDGYDPTQPLRWEDLEEPFCEINDVEQDDNMRYHMTCPSPGNKTGKHVIYNIWQRDLSPEAFYACIDVDFGNGIDLIFADDFE